MAKLSSRERREFIGLRLNAEWGWEGYQKQPGGYSYREMLGALARTFGVGNVPSQPMTIRRDIDWLREQAALPDVGAQAEARGLLDPELFPEWRAKFFRVPETGEPFQTPKFQHAIFWVMHAATFKVPLPAWVIELLDELDPKHPFPDDINDLLTGGEESFLSFLLLLAPRHGKAVDVATPMLSRRGWLKASEVRVGDFLVAADGGWTAVEGVFPQGETDAFEVTFSDGVSLVTSPDHRWEVQSRKGSSRVVTTRELYDGPLFDTDGHARYRIPMMRPAVGVTHDLPIDPYLFGCWLGDGSSYKAEITSADDEILAAFDRFYERGVRTHQNGGKATTVGYLGLQEQLRLLGVLGGKWVPEKYLLADANQRLALLQGLLDTDGSCDRNGQIEFCNKSRILADAVLSLVWSLGGTAKLYSRVVGGTTYWRVSIAPGGWDAFRLERKQVNARKKRKPVRTIRSVERVHGRETVCFAVADPRHLFAAGREMILTHNTELMVHFVLHTFATDQNKRVMFGNGTQKKSEGFIDNAIMSMLEGNDVSSQEFVDMFGPFRDKDRPWSKMGFTLAGREHSTKSYSLQPFGVSGNIRSFDADVILGDDLTDLKRARSETVTDEDYAWVTTELMLRREWQTSFVLTGSHVATQSGDLFTRFLSNLDRLNVGKQRLIVKTIPAHFYDRCDPVRDPLHNRCVLWPEGGRTYGFLEAQRAALNDDAMFEAVYNQIPQSQSMLHFPAEVLRSPFAAPVFTGDPSPPPQRDPDEPFGCLDYSRSWKDLPVVCCGKQAVVGLGFDPAASERKGASYSAVRVDAVCTLCARRYAVDHFKDRVSPEQHPALLEPFFDAYRPEIVTIEINAYQKALARDPRILKLQEKYRFEIKEFTTDERKHDPEFGIPQYGRHMKAGMYSIPYASVVDQEYAEPLLKAYIRWPQKPNDEVMAGWLCDLGLQELLEASRYLQAELMPGSERWATDFHTESTVTFDLSQAEPDEWVYA